jgi:hypothetical protein
VGDHHAVGVSVSAVEDHGLAAEGHGQVRTSHSQADDTDGLGVSQGGSSSGRGRGDFALGVEIKAFAGELRSGLTVAKPFHYYDTQSY